MVNDCRKSDRLVVPKKSSNKPDNVGAEKMEGRGLPKENKQQQNMLRTQRREGVLSKLQLIHQKAKSDTKMRFTTLMHHIYEVDFMGFSYGFRPGRGQHQALDALYVGISSKKVNYVFDADIRDFFNRINRGWLIKFIEHRIADKRVVKLIQKWLNAGILDKGEIIHNDQGTVQCSSASPLLANVFLYYVYDLWVQHWRKFRARGEIIVVRFADDTVVGFQYESDANQFQTELKERLLKFDLELHPEKTRLIEFGRFAAEKRETWRREPETFTFLGFTHICGKTRKGGKFAILRHTIKKRMQAKVKEIKEELTKRMHILSKMLVNGSKRLLLDIIVITGCQGIAKLWEILDSK